MGKAERKFEQTFGYDPKIIEPPLSQQDMWNTIKSRKSILSPNKKYIYSYENFPKEKIPFLIFERIDENGTKESATLLGEFSNNPEKILPYLDEGVWLPEK